MARLNVCTVEERLDKLAGRDGHDREFLFELLRAYGKPKGTVTRLRMGDLNVVQDKRDVLLKKMVFFWETGANRVSLLITRRGHNRILSSDPHTQTI